MNNLRWALSGFALGLVLALAPSCGPATPKCTASNCSGCCNEDGKCELGTLSNACGLNASACVTCGPADQCQGGFCRPITGSQKDAGTDAGTDAGNNDDGGTDAGNDGGTDGGVCSAATCPTGCCNAAGQCVAGGSQDNLQCGSGGAACSTCTSPFVCNTTGGTGGFCQDTTCTGCVESGGTCVAGTVTSACGANGVACVACGSGQSCTNGVCTGGTTCGPSNCNGCCVNNVCKVGTSSTECGTGGQACGVCGSGQTCVSSGTGGTCQTTTSAAVGSPCTNNSQCASLGTGAVCKLNTLSGNATYSGGYCSMPCTGPGTCPGTAECLNLLTFGDDVMCLQHCDTTVSGSCRSGYTCLGISDTTNDGICWIDPFPTPPVAPANLIGAPCTSDTSCQNGGGLPGGACFTEFNSSSMNTGWTGGSCTADCGGDPATICGTTGICLGFQNTTGDQFSLCMDRCTSGGIGQSDCRTGYVCEQYGLADGGTSTDGYCWPNCNNVSGFCGTSATCTTTGYCQ